MSYHPRHSSATKEHLSFALIILLLSAVWVHKTGKLHIEHGAIYLACFIAIAIVLFFLLKNRQKVTGKIALSKSSLTVIDKMTGLEFERYLTGLLRKQGYSSIRLTEKYDYGIDIIAIKDGITWGIQAKRYKGLVDVDAVRQVVTALAKYNCDRAMVITNSYYTEFAKELARCNNCLLIDRDKLKHWVVY